MSFDKEPKKLYTQREGERERATDRGKTKLKTRFEKC